jgi:hypothetical protein
MATRNIKDLAKLKEQAMKAFYVNAEWETADDDIYTLKEFAQYFLPSVKYINGDVTIIAKTTNDGETFLKASYPLKGGSTGEFPLAFENDFEEGDMIAYEDIRFAVERKLDKTHIYLTGEVS